MTTQKLDYRTAAERWALYQRIVDEVERDGNRVVASRYGISEARVGQIVKLHRAMLAASDR